MLSVRAFASIALATFAALTGCSECGAPKRSAAPPLILGTIEEPDTLDPVFTEVAGAQEIVRLLFRDLTVYDERWKLVPQLAAAMPKVETSSTSTTGAFSVVWTLKPELTWSDGQGVTTADIIHGYRIASDPTLPSTAKQVTMDVAKMTALSPLELRVAWKRPYPGYQGMRVHPILPAHAYPFGRAPISDGPYQLESWRPGEQITLTANPHWKGPDPKIKTIVFRFFKTEDAFEAELRTGGIDALGEASGLSLERAAGIEQRLSTTHAVHYTDSGLFLQLAARADDPSTGDLQIRQAIAAAIDRRALAKVVYGGRATPAYGCFPPRHAAHQNALPQFEAQPVKREQPLRLKMQFASGSQTSERAAAFVQAELRKIDIELTLEAMPLRALFGKMREKTHAPLVLFAWRSSPDWDAYAMLHSSGAQNYGGFKDAELDRLLDRAKYELDPAAWANALGDVERRYNALLPTIPLVFRQAVSVRPIGLAGWSPTGAATPVTWNAEVWRWDPPAGAARP